MAEEGEWWEEEDRVHGEVGGDGEGEHAGEGCADDGSRDGVKDCAGGEDIGRTANAYCYCEWVEKVARLSSQHYFFYAPRVDLQCCDLSARPPPVSSGRGEELR